jgi:hypothetical protein
MGSDSVKPKCDLEPFYMAIHLSRETWIRGPKAATDFQGIVWFTDSCWTEKGAECGTHGPKTRLFSSVGKEMCKKRIWKGASLSICGSVGETRRETLRDKQIFGQLLHLRPPRVTYRKALEKEALSIGTPSRNLEEGLLYWRL